MATANKQEPARAKSPTRAKGQELHAIIAAKFGEAVELVDAVNPFTVVKDPILFPDVMRFLRHDPRLEMDFLRSVTGVDWPDESLIDSVYHLYSYKLAHAHVLKYRCARAAPEVTSVESIWPVANWFEREAYDLFGIIYLKHSDLRRIMLPEDWVGHPLLKDYNEQEDYRGIGTTRASPLEAFKQMDQTRLKTRQEKGLPAPPLQKSAIVPPAGSTAAPDDEEEAKE